MIVKLTKEHIDMVRGTFVHNKYMDVNIANNSMFVSPDEMNKKINEVLYESFCNNYLMDLDNFHAFGKIENEKVVTLISFYESIDEPSWYYTNCRSIGKPKFLKELLDSIIEYNESNGRLKFYTLLIADQQKAIRRFYLSDKTIERYDYFDEYTCKERQKPFFNQHWEILYKRILVPANTIVRCSYLKNKYRTTLPNLGNI
jgi:hypothetical protein